MKVILLSNEYGDTTYGGAGVYVNEVSNALREFADVEVLHFGEKDLKHNIFDENTLSMHEPHLKSVFHAIENNLQFVAKIKDADIINCHTWYTFLAGMFCKMLYDIPLVLTFHSVEEMRPWKREQIKLGYNYSLWAEKTAAQLSDMQICVSKSVAKEVISAYSTTKNTTKVINCGLNHYVFKPTYDTTYLSSLGIDPNKPYILFSGRISKQKGIDYFLDVIFHINTNVQVILCANSPDTPELLQHLKENLQKYQKKVLWISELIPQEKLVILYSHAKIFVSTSIYEPFGMVNLEALACGAPVVARNVGGISGIVTNGYNGYLVSKSSSPKKFASYINRILSSTSLHNKFHTNALLTAKADNFNWSNVAERIFKNFKTLVKANV